MIELLYKNIKINLDNAKDDIRDYSKKGELKVIQDEVFYDIEKEYRSIRDNSKITENFGILTSTYKVKEYSLNITFTTKTEYIIYNKYIKIKRYTYIGKLREWIGKNISAIDLELSVEDEELKSIKMIVDNEEIDLYTLYVTYELLDGVDITDEIRAFKFDELLIIKIGGIYERQNVIKVKV